MDISHYQATFMFTLVLDVLYMRTPLTFVATYMYNINKHVILQTGTTHDEFLAFAKEGNTNVHFTMEDFWCVFLLFVHMYKMQLIMRCTSCTFHIFATDVV